MRRARYAHSASRFLLKAEADTEGPGFSACHASARDGRVPSLPSAARAQKLPQAHSILLEAWYPLGHGDRRLLEKPVFVRLANRYGKTPAQTVLRWHVQMGTSVIPSSTNPAHIAANADIFDFSLSTFEMAEIAALDGKRHYFHQNRMSLLVYRMMRPDFDAQR